MTSPAKVLAIGWFGERNLGDEAMLDGLLKVLDRALGPTNATVTTSDPDDTARRHGTRTIKRPTPDEAGFRNFGWVRQCQGADLVTLGGGDLIREQTDGTVPALNWLSRLRVPLRLRRPTAVIGVSVSDLFSPTVIDEVSAYLRGVSVIAARDGSSAARLAELSGKTVLRMGDLALEALEPLPPSLARSGPPRIGVSTRDILGRGPSVPDGASGELRGALAAALDRIVEATGARIELVPLRTRGPKVRPDDDAREGEALAALARTGEQWVRHDSAPDVAGYAAIAVDLDLIVSVRLHGAVLGAAAGRRVLGIAYDPKVDGFLSEIGVPEQSLPLAATADELEAAIHRSLDDATLEGRIRTGVADARARTRELEPLLRGLVRRD